MNILQKLLKRLSLGTYRKTITDHQLKLINEFNYLEQQLFLQNPYLIIGKVKLYLPLFYVDHIQRIVFGSRDFYEIETLLYLKQQFRQFDSVIDIGTNIGNHMLFWCSEMGATHVLCFEPNEFNRSVLIENIKINHLDSNVTVYGCALGSKAGEGVQRDFSISNTGMNRIERVENMPDKQSKVEIRSLDSFNVESVNFLKIDVEGFELEVLKGGIDTLQRCKPIILVEVFDENLREVDDFMFKMSYKKLKTLEDYNLIYVPDFN